MIYLVGPYQGRIFYSFPDQASAVTKAATDAPARGNLNVYEVDETAPANTVSTAVTVDGKAGQGVTLGVQTQAAPAQGLLTGNL